MTRTIDLLAAVLGAALLAACGGAATSATSPSSGPETLAMAVQGGSGNGAVVVRSDDEAFNLSFLWNDAAAPGQEQLIAVLSGDPTFGVDFFCSGEDLVVGEGWLWLAYHEVASPANRFLFTLHGDEHTRVYRAVVPAEATNAWACSLLTGELGPLLASGVSRYQWNFATNDCVAGPPRDNQTIRGSGILAAPACSSERARFAFSLHYQLAKDAAISPDCTLLDPEHDILRLRAEGPDLTCLGD